MAGRAHREDATGVRHGRAPRGLDDEVTPHVLRHTSATWLVQAGVPLWEVAGFLEMTVEMVKRIYGHHAPEHLQRAARALR